MKVNKVGDINITETIEQLKKELSTNYTKDKKLKSLISLLFIIIDLLLKKLNLNSSNSSIPPSKNPLNKKKKIKRKGKKRKPGGQNGHQGSNLELIDEPDVIIPIKIDLRTIPKDDYETIGYERRQVIDIKISRVISEYQAEIVRNKKGDEFVATFPYGITRPTQYGPDFKSNCVYSSMYQLIPYNRVVAQSMDFYGIKISSASIFNFNLDAYNRLEGFETWAIKSLTKEDVAHADETGINISALKAWIHVVSGSSATLFYVDYSRGTIAMDKMGILPNFKGILCHDHWSSYMIYSCKHIFCHAHYLRELTWAHEEDGQRWAKLMKNLLLRIKKEIDLSKKDKIPEILIEKFTKNYQNILREGQLECPVPLRVVGTKGRIKKGKSRNLLERFIKFETENLMFLNDLSLPFTNNQAERDLRMTKVQQKVSGCFRSMEGAKVFARIRSYIITCKKHNIEPHEALSILFQGKRPSFMNSA